MSGKEILERILDDGSDSDSDLRQVQLEHAPQHAPRSFRVSGPFHTASRLSSLTMDADLERILRETDDEDEGDDEDEYIDTNRLSTARRFGIDTEALEESSNSSLHQFEVIRSSAAVDTSTKHSLSTLSASVASKLTPSKPSERRSNTDDWTLLQKIMDEKEDDLSQEANLDSRLDEPLNISDRQKSYQSLKKTTNQNVIRKYSNLSDVDAILENIGFDDDDDDESDVAAIAELDDLASRFRSIHALSVSAAKYSSTFKKDDSLVDSFPPLNFSRDSKLRIDTTKSSHTYGASFPETNVVHKDPMTVSSDEKNSWTKIPMIQKGLSMQKSVSSPTKAMDSMSPICQATSDAAIKYAESQEARLIRPTSRDVISPLMVKRRMKPKIDLPTKSRLGKNCTNINTQTHPRYNFAGVIDSKVFSKISSVLLRNSQAVQRDLGLPTALAVNSKFIAIGTQHGYALIFDHFEEIRQKLGLASSGINLGYVDVSVTSLDLSSNGETLISGYSNGALILWDIIKGVVMKSVNDLHSSPITACRFVSDQAMNIVSVDAGGLVNRVIFSKTIWSSVGMESECLLDGTAGQILAMHVLPSFSTLKGASLFDGRSSVYSPLMRKLVLMALTSDRSSFAIAIEPTIHVLHRWPRPSVDQSTDSHVADTPIAISALPCLAWGWVLISGGENVATPILARSWGCSLQFLRAIFPPSEEINRTNSDDQTNWPAFGLHDEFEASDEIVALEWLGDRSLVYLTITNEFTVIDSVMMTLTERLDFSGIKLVYAELALSRTAMTTEKSSTRPNISTTFLNSVRSNDERILILCREELRAVSILNIHKRVQTLEEDGEWLEALALALDHYESSVKSQEDRKRDPEGKRDLSSHPEFLTRLRLSEDDEWLADLLLRYLFLAVENAPDSTLEPLNATTGTRISSTRKSLSNTHFQMLAGVCIEFCIVARRIDLLFTQVFEKFQTSGSSPIFFQVLEPYIMNDKLKYVGAEVMAQFVHHCKINNDLSTVERCLIHMDVSIMDFDSMVSLLRKNSMYSALIHVYTAGLDDYTTPLQILFEAIFDNCELGHISLIRRIDGVPLNPFEQFGYKTMLYLRHSLSGKAFPRGDPVKPHNRVETIRPALLFFLTQRQYIPFRANGGGFFDGSRADIIPLRELDYPYLRALMLLDPKSVFDTYSIVLDDPSVRFMKSAETMEIYGEWHDITPNDNEQRQDKTLCPDRQDIARTLSLIMEDLIMNGSLTPAPFSVDCFHDFLAKYLSQGVIRTPRRLTTKVFSRICTKASRLTVPSERKEVEGSIISLLQILPPTIFDIDDILQLLEHSKLTRAALYLHKTGVHLTPHDISRHFVSVIDCYLQEEDPYFQREVFAYIKEECSKDCVIHKEEKSSISSKMKMNRSTLRSPLLEKLPNLVLLDALQSARLVTDLYIDDLDTILQTLDCDDGHLLYTFLDVVINGELTKIDPYAGPLLQSSLTIAHYSRYLELMARFHPDLVYGYLLTHDNYRFDECLKLCQSQDIPDASAYLLERLGNVSGALQLLLQTLEGRLMILKRKIRGFNVVSHSTVHLSPQTYLKRLNDKENETLLDVMSTREYQCTMMILRAILDLCERNSNSQVSTSEYGSQLWLNVVDRLINAKGLLRLQNEKPEHVQVLLHIVADLLHTTLQHMVKRVSSSELIRMVISDHATHRLSDLREIISVILHVYGSEAYIYSNAVSVLRADVYNMVLMKHNLKRRTTKAFDLSKAIVDLTKITNGSIIDIDYLSNILFQISRDGDVFVQSFDGQYQTKEKVGSSKKVRDNRSYLNKKHPKVPSVSNFGGMLKTRTDALFEMGDSSEAASFFRQYGAMTHAEHFGRLV